MDIEYRKCNQYGSVQWTEVKVTHDNTTVNFDVSGSEQAQLIEHLLDTGFDLLPDMNSVFEYLKKKGYWGDIKEQIEEENAEEESAA